MTDAVTARLFDVMRDEASKEGITIDNTELLMGGNETKSSAMKAFVENNLSKYPGAEAELRRMFGEEVETPEVPAWITNNQPAIMYLNHLYKTNQLELLAKQCHFLHTEGQLNHFLNEKRPI